MKFIADSCDHVLSHVWLTRCYIRFLFHKIKLRCFQISLPAHCFADDIWQQQSLHCRFGLERGKRRLANKSTTALHTGTDHRQLNLIQMMNEHRVVWLLRAVIMTLQAVHLFLHFVFGMILYVCPFVWQCIANTLILAVFSSLRCFMFYWKNTQVKFVMYLCHAQTTFFCMKYQSQYCNMQQ